MGEAARLAQRLRAALRAEEPRAVEQLLRRGADPNLVLADGAAAMHLAAGARRPRALRCLEALLRQGGDPNARSAEALTPLHVAAAWGCRRGLELLLSQGADPALRDQDGLRPLDLAAQQGHRVCARVLSQLHTRPAARAEGRESQPEPRGPDASQYPHATWISASLQPQAARAEGRDLGVEPGPSRPSLPGPPEVPVKAGSSGSFLGSCDCSSDLSFVTAVEGSEPEDQPLDRTPPQAGPLSQTKQGRPDVCPPQRTPRSAGGPQPSHGTRLAGTEEALAAHLQALALTPADAAGVHPSPSSAALGFLQELLPGPHDLSSPPGDATPLDSASAAAALWLTEDAASATEGGASALPGRHLLVPARSAQQLLRGVQVLPASPGPLTSGTPPNGLRRLQEAQAAPGPDFSGYSRELAEALRTGRIPDSQADEDALAQQFERPDPVKRWREGVVKSSFTYLLLDPRETQDLPARALSLTPAECLQTFVRAIFYVGKGTRARPDIHLWEALSYRRRPRKQACPKVRQILDIWDSGRGVVSLHCFQHLVAVEAYTREACLVDALGIRMLTNQKQGHYYGVVAGWTPARRRRLGVHLLHRALLVFLAEGERELRPQDIQARG